MELPLKTEKRKMAFHQGWASGGHDNWSYEITCGAGIGNWLIHFRLKNKETGEEISESASIEPAFNKWVESKIEEMEAKLETV